MRKPRSAEDWRESRRPFGQEYARVLEREGFDGSQESLTEMLILLNRKPSTIGKALYCSGHEDWGRIFTAYACGREVGRSGPMVDYYLEELDRLSPIGPEEFAKRMGVTPGAIARTLQRAGKHREAAPFNQAQYRRRSRLASQDAP